MKYIFVFCFFGFLFVCLFLFFKDGDCYSYQLSFQLIVSILNINNIYKMPYKMQSMIKLNDFVFHSKLDKI